ncbi:MAG: phosphoribosylformylglycinamidine synthase subunit PurL [Candidatus Thermoplasmatota archaeon]|nr:phosphoribosylformylglycinamidine synthase subunit PurL [Candidatus Thermoplasmatota archaeon]
MLEPVTGVKKVYWIDLEGDLTRVVEDLGLGLLPDEIENVRKHFLKEKRKPTDVELQAIDQAWSEHCCYKSSKPVLEDTVFGLDSSKKVIAREDAGIMEFDDEHYYAVGLESHNHPSALDPYGGAATGIGGILRDVVCMGAQPVALVDPLFFGDLDIPSEELMEGIKHPRYLMRGVVAGIRDYGNRVGVPTIAGQVSFHPRYTGNPLVTVGCVGMVRKDMMIHSRAGDVGDIYILAGGRTGRDGIHGVTFASRELDAGSDDDIGAVQLGDPITKEPLMHLCLELNEMKLLTGMKDLGGGGLSCVVGELALDGGFGASVNLEKVPLKVENMAPWEIWVSESQERMMFTVKPENVEQVLARCEAWDVEAVTIGEVITEKRNIVKFRGVEILNLDLEFTTGGPTYRRAYDLPDYDTGVATALPEYPKDLEKKILDVISHPEIASKDWVIRQYDHEVRGKTALKPIQGPIGRDVPGDSSVLKPVDNSWKGLALTADVNPYLMEANPYHGTMSAVEEVCRNLAAVGARIDSLADCLCFGNPQKPDIMGQFKASCEALRDAATAIDVPYVSGNVSLYNETAEGAIPPTPVLMGVGLVNDIRRCTTSDMKSEGTIWLVGKTKKEMGASLYYRTIGKDCPNIPKTDFDSFIPKMEQLIQAIEQGEVVACHDISTGGLAIAVIEMCMSGIGAKITLTDEMRADIELFSESNGRWIVQVAKGLEDDFAERFKRATKIGDVGDMVSFSKDNKIIAEFEIEELRNAWKAPVWERLA